MCCNLGSLWTVASLGMPHVQDKTVARSQRDRAGCDSKNNSNSRKREAFSGEAEQAVASSSYCRWCVLPSNSKLSA